MIWLWLQAIIVLSLAFSGGLWLGRAMAAWTERKAAPPRAAARLEEVDDDVFPNYHGADIGWVPVSEPRVEVEPIAGAQPELLPVEPEPEVAVPAPTFRIVAATPLPKRWAMLFPVNQFGVLSETRAPL